MKIKECRVIIVWDDDTQENISYHIPEGLCEHIDDYLDLLERERNESLTIPKE
jgi:hypothetical protein